MEHVPASQCSQVCRQVIHLFVINPNTLPLSGSLNSLRGPRWDTQAVLEEKIQQNGDEGWILAPAIVPARVFYFYLCP